MIHIFRPEIKTEDSLTTVTINIDIDGESKVIWFRFEEQYAKYLTLDRGDALLLHLFYYAMEKGHDLEFDIPISERLLYQVKYNLMDALHKEAPIFHDVNIICETTVEAYPTGNAIGTGISCGVDSLTTIYTHNKLYPYESLKINLLTFFNVGAFHRADGSKVIDNDGSEIMSAQLANAKDFALEAQLPLMFVDSNLATEVLCPHDMVDAVRNCGVVLMFQKLFRIYYYSSTYRLNEFHISPLKGSGYYEIYTLQNISLDKTNFYCSNVSSNRLEKTAMLLDYDLAHKHLNVCTTGGKNCGVCSKCVRTLTSLDALNGLKYFKSVFNLERYKKKRSMQIGYVIASRNKVYYKEIYSALKHAHKIPLLSWLYAFGFILLKPIENYMQKLTPDLKKKLLKCANKYHIRVPY